MALPNFLIIGVGKSGTTSLYHYLGQHPQIAVSRIREPKFLMYAGHLLFPIQGKTPHFRVFTVEEYEALYAGNENRPARLDISPSYLVFPEQTIPGIRKYTPDVKMMVIYRQPADRGYSNYLMHVRMGDETLAGYPEALAAEAAGIPRVDGRPRTYFNRGFYLERTKAFLQAFPRERFLFLLYDDLARDPAELLRTIFQFLEVDSDFTPDMRTRHNAGSWPRSQFAHRMVTSTHPIKRRLAGLIPSALRKQISRRFYALNLQPPPQLDPALRRELTLRYREDILGLQDLIGRDLSGWLAG